MMFISDGNDTACVVEGVHDDVGQDWSDPGSSAVAVTSGFDNPASCFEFGSLVTYRRGNGVSDSSDFDSF